LTITSRRRLVDLRDGLILVDVVAAHDRRLAVDHVRLGEECALLPVERRRHAANADVAFRDEVVHQVRPRRLHELGLNAERVRERFGHVDVDSFELAIRLVVRVRLVVAGRAGAQGAVRDDLVET
jgi:hypothetical protein